MDSCLKHKRLISKEFLGKVGIRAVGTDGDMVILYISNRESREFLAILPKIKQMARPYKVKIEQSLGGAPRFA